MPHMKRTTCLLLSLLVFGFAVEAEPFSVKIGQTKASLISPTETAIEIKINQPTMPLTVLELPPGKDPVYEIDWEIKDDSRTAGFPLKVTGELKAYDFSRWILTNEGTESITVGDNSGWNKYDEIGTWYLRPPVQPVVRLTCLMSAKTKMKEGLESGSFYAAMPIPESNPRPQQIKLAAARWVAGRLELGIIFNSLGQIWRKTIKNESLANNDQLINSLRMTSSFVTVQDFAAGNGYPFLGVVGLDFLASPLLLPGGAISEAYSWRKWGEKSLSGTISGWPLTLGNLAVQQLLATEGGDLDAKLLAAGDACRDEAQEAIRIMYTQPTDPGNVWLEKLLAERAKLKEVAARAAETLVKIKAAPNGFSENDRLCLIALIETIQHLAEAEAAVLDKALASN